MMEAVRPLWSVRYAHGPERAHGFHHRALSLGRQRLQIRRRQLNPQMAKLKNVCVYCGSAKGSNPAYSQAARALGSALAREKIRLVYGGGGIGMMGEVARGVEDAGGKVLGIIPDFLVAREHAAQGGREIVRVRDMHERKRAMSERADAFVALPGGIGTLEELVEQLAWVQLGRHKKPVLIANIKFFWQPLCALLDHMKKLKFIRGDLDFDLLVADKVGDILPMLQKVADAVPEAAKKMTAAAPDQM